MVLASAREGGGQNTLSKERIAVAPRVGTLPIHKITAPIPSRRSDWAYERSFPFTARTTPPAALALRLLPMYLLASDGIGC